MRKFLAFVLAMTLVLGTLPMTATAAVGPGQKLKDIADHDNAEAIQVCFDLKIVEGTPEGTYEPTKPVNRAEFAALVTRALAIPKSALDSYTSTTFRDTSGYTWAVPYLAFCQQKGIMKGNGYGDAMPGRTINANEAVTMVLRAIGYTDNASVLVGQWPANYVSLAQSQQLYSDVAGENDIDKAAAAQIIYNALTSQLVQVDANSLVTKLFDLKTDAKGVRIEVPRCLLTAGLNCVSNGEAVVTFADAASSSINLTPQVGALATLYKNNGSGKFVAITEIKTVFLPGKFTFTKGKEVDKYKLIDGTEYSVNNHDKGVINNHASKAGIGDIVMFKNGDDHPAHAKYTDYLTEGKTGSDSDKLILGAKVNGKTITEICSIAVWDAQHTFRWDSDSLEADKTEINKVGLPKDDFGDVDHNAYMLLGADSIEDIKDDNVVYLFKNDAGKIARIEVGTETHTGKVTKVNSDGADFNKATIGGKELGTSPYFDSPPGDIKINNEGTAFLDYYSRIFDFDLAEASKGSYAVLLDKSTDTWSTDIAKIFDKNGDEKVYSVKDTVSATGSAFSLATKNTLIELGLSGGKVSKVIAGNKVTTSTAIAGKYGKINKAGTVLSHYGDKALTIEAGVVVFVKDGNDFSIGSINDIKDKELEYPFQYILTDADANKGNVAALIVDANDAGASTILIMVMGTSWGTDGDDRVSIVKGLAFKDGANAKAKEWNFTDDNFKGEVVKALNASGYYSVGSAPFPVPEILEFKINDDGVLKVPSMIVIDKDDRRLSTIRNTVATSVALGVEFGGDFGGGTASYVMNAQGDTQSIAIESGALLYSIDGDDWKVEKPTKAIMNKYKDEGHKFIFLKSDKDNGYDIIIRVG